MHPVSGGFSIFKTPARKFFGIKLEFHFLNDEERK
jgi:hypothetical protein